MQTIIDIDPAWSINELLRRHPAAGRVLNALGIDSCCGGAASLRETARADDIELDTLITAIAAEVRERGE